MYTKQIQSIDNKVDDVDQFDELCESFRMFEYLIVKWQIDIFYNI